MTIMSTESVRVLIVDDEDAFRTGLRDRLKRKGFTVFDAASGEEAISIAQQNLLDVALVDIRMPGMDGIELLTKLKEAHPSIEVIILTGVASVETAIEAMKLGAYDYLSKPCRFDELKILVDKAYEKKKLREENILLQKRLKRFDSANEFIGSSENAMKIRKFIQTAAQADCPVLLEGESGTGKEVIAREIHRQSARAEARFVVFDCTMWDALLPDELLGHEKGAYTTAIDSRQGLLEITNGGTLLFDEIGDMEIENQKKLLRIVETNTFRRIGGSKDINVDVRIIASTNKVIKNEIAKGNFRQDLFYRLEVMHYVVPTLRERKDDIPLIAEYFLEGFNDARDKDKRLTMEQKNFLKTHNYPGNIRELFNLIERSFHTSGDNEFQLDDFMKIGTLSGSRSGETKPSSPKTLDDMIREHILRILRENNGNKKETAKALGISRSRLYNMLNKFENS
jgi:DNA-binding NtrC family response regulator